MHKVACACVLVILGAWGVASAAEKPDEYGDVCWKREKEVLRNVAIQLRNEPEARAYLIYYAGRRTPSMGAAQRRGSRAKEFLLKLGIGPERILAVDGGFREEFTWEVWFVPPGATPPAATPTVERGEVKVAGKARERPCR